MFKLKNNAVALKTFKYEQIRAISLGILETASSTFILLIAVRHFQLSANLKWLATSGESFGLLLCPLLVYFVAKNKIRSTKAIAIATFLGGIGMFIAAIFPNILFYSLGSVIAMCSVTVITPLATQMYSDNYPEETRGTLYSLTRIIRVISAIIFAYFIGKYFTGKIHLFQYLLFIYALALFLNAYCLNKCPSNIPKEENEELKLLRGFSYIKDDLLFRNTLICWMIIGFGNLISAPLRIEYLANTKYSLNFSESQIALFVSIIPNITKLILTPIWGMLFDRISFFMIRFLSNLGFMLGILGFFTSNTETGFLFSAIFYGIAMSGGDVTWNLWVTKFAPKNRVADYMAVHIFLTGIRFLIAPLLAFHLINTFSISTIGIFCAILALISNYWLLPGLKKSRNQFKNIK